MSNPRREAVDFSFSSLFLIQLQRGLEPDSTHTPEPGTCQIEQRPILASRLSTLTLPRDPTDATHIRAGGREHKQPCFLNERSPSNVQQIRSSDDRLCKHHSKSPFLVVATCQIWQVPSDPKSLWLMPVLKHAHAKVGSKSNKPRSSDARSSKLMQSACFACVHWSSYSLPKFGK